MAERKYQRHPLAVLRTHKNLTQQMLADFTQLSKPTIQRAESGLPIRPQSRQMLCDYFGKSAEELGLLPLCPGTSLPVEPLPSNSIVLSAYLERRHLHREPHSPETV